MSEYLTIDIAANGAVADLIRRRLDENGIPCVPLPCNTAAVACAGAAFSVTVPDDRAAEDRQLIKG